MLRYGNVTRVGFERLRTSLKRHYRHIQDRLRSSRETEEQEQPQPQLQPRVDVLNTLELLENILVQLKLRDLHKMRKVCSRFRDVIDSSPTIARKMFRQPDPSSGEDCVAFHIRGVKAYAELKDLHEFRLHEDQNLRDIRVGRARRTFTFYLSDDTLRELVKYRSLRESELLICQPPVQAALIRIKATLKAKPGRLRGSPFWFEEIFCQNSARFTFGRLLKDISGNAEFWQRLSSAEIKRWSVYVIELAEGDTQEL